MPLLPLRTVQCCWYTLKPAAKLREGISGACNLAGVGGGGGGEEARRKTNKACAVKNWTTFEGLYFNNGMGLMKKN